LLHDWRNVLTRLTLLTTLLAASGWLVGQVLLTILLGLLLYLCYTLYQIVRLNHWLHTTISVKDSPPPEAGGVWGDIFDGIYKLQRREWQATDHLKNILDKAQESSAALDIAVVMINSRGNLEWWNRAAEKLLGFKPQDQRQAVANLIREPRFLEYFQSEKYRTPLQLPSPVSSRIMLEFQITRFGAGERLMLVRDISRVHKLESMRKDFVGNVSHELRTPITVITGYLETLLDNREGIPERWNRPLEQMYQQSRRLEAIITDLLTLSGLETRAVPRDPAPVALTPLLEGVLHDAEKVYADKRHHFSLEGAADLTLAGNSEELYSAFSNLVLNAAKYTPPGGHIRIICSKGGSLFSVSVEDDGPGIEEHHLPRLTERFYRVDESRSSTTGGTGLGLAIVKHSLARNGGVLEIFSEVGAGSRFACCFPLDQIGRSPIPT
jgi:two-component system, OmpR family, phosphate regulon sensor histidine kinase PhoR